VTQNYDHVLLFPLLYVPLSKVSSLKSNLMNQGHAYDSGARSPRPETPEPSSIQGRRNTGAQLLDHEGGISDQASSCKIVWTASLNVS
jgi:hypothetical protein